MSFNLQYLMLQQNMQTESQQYTTASNALKSENDSAQGMISNLK